MRPYLQAGKENGVLADLRIVTCSCTLFRGPCADKNRGTVGARQGKADSDNFGLIYVLVQHVDPALLGLVKCIVVYLPR